MVRLRGRQASPKHPRREVLRTRTLEEWCSRAGLGEPEGLSLAGGVAASVAAAFVYSES